MIHAPGDASDRFNKPQASHATPVRAADLQIRSWPLWRIGQFDQVLMPLQK
ncbi:hypothetical protein ACVW1C_001038 [Bradyrhizobium sp. USDA 4011]